MAATYRRADGYSSSTLAPASASRSVATILSSVNRDFSLEFSWVENSTFDRPEISRGLRDHHNRSGHSKNDPRDRWTQRPASAGDSSEFVLRVASRFAGCIIVAGGCMKSLHRSDLLSWSCFDEKRNVDFCSVAWIRPGGNVLIDPLPMTEHDRAHLASLGGATLIIITNSDHTRGAQGLAQELRATLCGPRAERGSFPLQCEHWLGDGDEPVPGLHVLEMHGSKTPGELALFLERTTLITGDLVRGHMGGKLNLLPDAKLTDRARAIASVQRILDAYPDIETVLVGDGWPVFHDGRRALAALCGR